MTVARLLLARLAAWRGLRLVARGEWWARLALRLGHRGKRFER